MKQEAAVLRCMNSRTMEQGNNFVYFMQIETSTQKIPPIELFTNNLVYSRQDVYARKIKKAYIIHLYITVKQPEISTCHANCH